jgi:hypothetical protein
MWMKISDLLSMQWLFFDSGVEAAFRFSDISTFTTSWPLILELDIEALILYYLIFESYRIY